MSMRNIEIECTDEEYQKITEGLSQRDRAQTMLIMVGIYQTGHDMKAAGLVPEDTDDLKTD